MLDRFIIMQVQMGITYEQTKLPCGAFLYFHIQPRLSPLTPFRPVQQCLALPSPFYLIGTLYQYFFRTFSSLSQYSLIITMTPVQHSCIRFLVISLQFLFSFSIIFQHFFNTSILVASQKFILTSVSARWRVPYAGGGHVTD